MGCSAGPDNKTQYGIDVINISNLITDQLKLYWDAGRTLSFNLNNADVFWKDISNSADSRKFALRSNGYGSSGEPALSTPFFSSDAGGSFVFDGVNDFGTLMANSSTNNGWTGGASYPTGYSPWFPGSNVTISVWMKTTSGRDEGFWSHCNGGPVNLSYGIGGGKMRYWYYTAPWQILDSTTSISDNRWHNLVWAKSGTNMRQYIDGNLDRNDTLVGDVNGPLYSLSSRWGPCYSDGYGANTNSYGSVFTGSLSIMMAYGKQLSAPEVLQNYNNLRGRFR
jgi:hypothetical protein